MDEVTGPVIAIALVLCAVFVPTAFMAGISGQFFKQFALTIAASTVISAFNSLTLSPALCAHPAQAARPRGARPRPRRRRCPGWASSLLGGLVAYFFLAPPVGQLVGIDAGRPRARRGRNGRTRQRRGRLGLAGGVCSWPAAWPAGWLAGVVNRALGAFFRGFNWVFDVTITGYGQGRAACSCGSASSSCWSTRGLMGLTYLGFRAVPVGFIPEQDKGYLVVNAQLPDGASLERTRRGRSASMTEMAREDRGRGPHHRRARATRC